ncbi:MAG: metalloregulator ArsR/SmtB family transcription factor [Actinomycetota bacterium]|nr:metalloregulator ArsR/SmtB family transcription factor [Actinomycetota bacterium]
MVIDNGVVKKIEPVEESCNCSVLHAPLEEMQAERIADAFRVVADSARLRILSLMANTESEESWVGELTEALGLSQPTVSHHLRVLHDAGLIEREARGNRTYYKLVCEQVEILRSVLEPRPQRTKGLRA